MRRFLTLLIVLSILFSSSQAAFAEHASQTQSAEALLEAMSVEERVGQLFIVSVEGRDLGEGSQIADMISRRHIGGLVLRMDRNNFAANEPLESAYKFNASLQELAWAKSQSSTGQAKAYIPLYLGIAQDGGMDPEQLLPGMQPLASQMSIGATWSPERAKDAGSALGASLNALGFNLFLGPNLDVVNTGTPAAEFDSTNTFGGNPYWVGQLARGYISGLHSGAYKRLQVIARHFPGLGSADRPPAAEVSTVQTSLADLNTSDFLPYFTITDRSQTEGLTDGLMLSHIRLQDLQGLASTRPITLDGEATTRLFSLEPLAGWREQGGLILSDDLGSPALRLVLDPGGANYDAVGTARQAFMAGNDLLYLNRFRGVGDASEFETIGRTLDSFALKYNEDRIFAERVNAAVLRILQAKLRLYGGSFDLQHVVPPAVALQNIASEGSVSQTNTSIVQEAATLLSPSPEYLRTLIPDPPGAYDYIVTFTDTRSLQTCTNCPAQVQPGMRDMQESLLRLYGPMGTRQLSENRVNAYSFEQLLEFVDNATGPTTPFMADNLKRAGWVVFLTNGVDPENPQSLALQRMLNEGMENLRDKRVIVFALGDPYDLDTTAISKLTAYYGLFGKTQAYIDMAARILMQESTPRGSAPVSLPMVGYDLARQTEPNPAQVIPISLLTQAPLEPVATDEPDSTPVPLFRLGESVRVQAGAIRDRNNYLVPDGTMVQFTIKLAGERLIIAQPSAPTHGGLAVVDYTIDRDGIFEVTAASGEALTSGTLVLNTAGGLAQVIMPTATPTLVPTPTPQPTSTPASEAEPTAEAGADHNDYPRMQDWLLMTMLLVLGFAVAYSLGFFWWGSNLWGIRAGLATVIGGLLAYLALTLGIGSLTSQMRTLGVSFMVQAAGIGMLFGWLAALLWWLRSTQGLMGRPGHHNHIDNANKS